MSSSWSARWMAPVVLMVLPASAQCQVMVEPALPVTVVLQQHVEWTSANVAGAAWLNDYRQAMRAARAGYAYTLHQPLRNLELRLRNLAKVHSRSGAGDWVTAQRKDELVGLQAPDLALRQDIRRGHINPQPIRPVLVAGAVQVTWLPGRQLQRALDQANEAVAAHDSGLIVWRDLQLGLARVKRVTYLQNPNALRAYELLVAAEASAPLDTTVSKAILLQAVALLRRLAWAAPEAAQVSRLAALPAPPALAIGAAAQDLQRGIARRARLWFAGDLAPRYSLSLKGISASSS